MMYHRLLAADRVNHAVVAISEAITSALCAPKQPKSCFATVSKLLKYASYLLEVQVEGHACIHLHIGSHVVWSANEAGLSGAALKRLQGM